MPIYHTHEFWDYVVDESEPIIERIKEILTRKDYVFETKTYNTSKYYQIISSVQLDSGKDIVLRFPAGLLNYLRSKVTLALQIAPSRYRDYEPEEILSKAEEIKALDPKFEVRDYQIDAVLASLRQFTSLIQSTTGSGKTSIMCTLCKVLNNKKTFITNGNNFILQQIYDRLVSFGETDISWNPGKTPDYSKRIVLMNTKGSDSKLNVQDQDYINFLKEVQLWIIDEAYHFQSLTNFEPLFYMDPDKLEHIVGYTATPFREKNPYKDPNDFTLIALLAEPAFQYTMKDTIADGNVAKPYGYFINYPNKKAFLPPSLEDNYYMQYRANITYNKARNKACVEMIKFLDKNGIKTLVSFNNIKPGQNMMKEVTEQGIRSMFICGDETIYEFKKNKRGNLKLETRSGTTDDVKQALAEGCNVVFGSQVMDEGVDISSFQAVILSNSGKAIGSLLQRIGRAIRNKTNGENVAFVIDFKDIGGHPIFQNHYLKRRQTMEEAGITIFNNVLDFVKLVEQVGQSNKNFSEKS